MLIDLLETDPRILSHARDLSFDPRTLTPMPKARHVLMVRPTHFRVDDSINPHMRASDGSLNTIDTAKAMAQWEELRATYLRLGFEVEVLEGGEDLPDMVFCANQTLPVSTRTGKRLVVLSNMADARRHHEVDLVHAFFQRHNYDAALMPARSPSSLFEGMGDCLWLPGRRFLLGGYGHRTSPGMYERVASIADAPVAIFELTSPRFYHLDTCLAILDDHTALACREAYTAEGWALLEAIFPRLLVVPLAEADSPQFACNAHCPDERNVILHPGSTRTEDLLRANGFTPVPVDTSEFIKSGGSVFCMKLMYF